MIKPTKRQQELLDLLQEECAEVIQIISKIRRFGFDSEHNGKTNADLLTQELTDFQILTQMAETMFGMSTYSYEYSANKVEKLKRFTSLFEAENDINAHNFIDGSIFK